VATPLVAGQSEDAKKVERCAGTRRWDAVERNAGPGRVVTKITVSLNFGLNSSIFVLLKMDYFRITFAQIFYGFIASVKSIFAFFKFLTLSKK
jgi:hypothetical protein